MIDQDLALAAEFAAPTEDQWLAAVDQVLKGASFDRLVSRTYDGIAIQPLYRAGAPAVDERPGQALYTRGRRAEGAIGGAWGIRQRYATPDPVAANAIILEDLDGGVSSVSLRLDLYGAGEIDGVVIGGAEDLDRLLDGVLVDLVTIVLDAGSRFADAAAMLIDLWDRRGLSGDERQGNLGADPLGVLAGSGRLEQGVDAALAALAELARRTQAWPSVRAVEIDTAAYVDAGASEAQELAAALAAGVAYLRVLESAGLSVDVAAAQIGFTLSADADVFATIAKFRAARRCWARIVEASGGSELAAAAPISARTAMRMMTQRDPWVNMLRTTAAAFGAAVGGAQSVTVEPFDAAIGEPDPLARRVARNTQLLLQEESHVARVIDPAGGSFYVEALTDELAAAAWAELGRIESSGGLAAALFDGSLRGRIAEVRDQRSRNIAKRKDPLTGVSEFPNLAELPIDRPASDVSGLRADAGRNAPAPPAGPASTCEPLGGERLAQPFESLRDASDRHLETSGARPRVFLANLGPIAAHTARATFARNFFEAGGIEAVGDAGYDDDAEMTAAWQGSATRVAVICGDDKTYASRAAAAASALKSAGASWVYLAGNPGDRRAAEESTGVDEFIHVGVDVLASLRTAHERLEVAP